MKNATKMSQIHPVVDLRSGLLVVSALLLSSEEKPRGPDGDRLTD